MGLGCEVKHCEGFNRLWALIVFLLVVHVSYIGVSRSNLPDARPADRPLVCGSFPSGAALTGRFLCAAINDGGGTIVLKPGVYEEPLLLEKGEKIVSLRSARVRCLSLSH